MASGATSSNRDWLRPIGERRGLQRFLAVARERWLIIAGITVAVIVVAIAYAALAEPTYEAEAELLVTPAPADAVTVALPLVREQADPSVATETVAQLLTSPPITAAVAQDLEPPADPAALADRVRAEPVSGSNVVAVLARAPSPEQAAELANAFAATAIELRRRELQNRIREILPRLRSRFTGAGSASPVLAGQIAQLEALRGGPDPTVRIDSAARPPTAAVSPRVALILPAALVLGLMLGMLAAYGTRLLDPRLRREEQLRELFRLPILARVPAENGRPDEALDPSSVSPQAIEAYRTLRSTLTAGQGPRTGSQVILITGPAPSEGKTTTAINVATLLALSGSRTILIEADLRRPAIAKALGARPTRGVVGYLLGQDTLAGCLTSLPSFGPDLQLMLAEHTGSGLPELFSLPIAQELLREARAAADYVIIDSPPLTEVSDALPLARAADDVLIVTHLGRSPLRKIKQLGELLADNGVEPTGFALLGTERNRAPYYYGPGLGNSSALPSEPPGLNDEGEPVTPRATS